MAIKADIYYSLPIYEAYINNELISRFLTEDQMLEIEHIKRNIKKEFLVRDCYCRIGQLTGGKEKIEFKLYIYDSKIENLIKVQKYNFVPNVDKNSTNFIKQCYEYLKTLDEFVNAIDILEEGQVV